MTNKENSWGTKLKLSEALKTLMAQKPLNKITVGELVRMCGVNRNTFYYHFEDIYDLLKWTLEQEAVEVVKNLDPGTNFHDSLLFVVDYVRSNKHILNCAYDELGRDGMKRFLYTDFIEVLTPLVENYEKKLGVTLSGDSRFLVIQFYVEALGGLLVDWFKEPEVWEREDFIDMIEVIITSSLPAAILGAAEAEI